MIGFSFDTWRNGILEDNLECHLGCATLEGGG